MKLPQLRALIRNNVRLKLRNKREVLNETLYPLVFTTIVCLINLSAKPSYYAGEPRHPKIDPAGFGADMAPLGVQGGEAPLFLAYDRAGEPGVDAVMAQVCFRTFNFCRLFSNC